MALAGAQNATGRAAVTICSGARRTRRLRVHEVSRASIITPTAPAGGCGSCCRSSTWPGSCCLRKTGEPSAVARVAGTLPRPPSCNRCSSAARRPELNPRDAGAAECNLNPRLAGRRAISSLELNAAEKRLMNQVTNKPAGRCGRLVLERARWDTTAHRLSARVSADSLPQRPAGAFDTCPGAAERANRRCPAATARSRSGSRGRLAALPCLQSNRIVGGDIVAGQVRSGQFALR